LHVKVSFFILLSIFSLKDSLQKKKSPNTSNNHPK